jgi:beta-1,2-mannobiose phosphorylase / 1,2-beta-oligomannan phosphorylase
MKKFYLERYPNNKEAKPILTPRKDIDWEAMAVFNPSVVHDNGIFHMLYRTFPKKAQLGEPRLKRPGFKLKNQISYIGYARSTDGIHFERFDTPFISPDQSYDGFGVEDPRITKIGDTFYITYTAIDKLIGGAEKPNVRIALASTKDFKAVEKQRHFSQKR